MKLTVLKRGKMIDKLKDNLASIAALIAAVVVHWRWFVKYGEITTKLNNIEANQGVDFAPIEKQIDELKERIDGLGGAIGKNKSANNDVNTKAQVNEKEIQLLKLQIQELQIKSQESIRWLINA